MSMRSKPQFRVEESDRGCRVTGSCPDWQRAFLSRPGLFVMVVLGIVGFALFTGAVLLRVPDDPARGLFAALLGGLGQRVNQ